MKLVKTWWLPSNEQHLEEWIIKWDDYQKPHRDHALSHVKNWDVCLDVGGHVGLWSRDFAAKFKQVHAFEPVEEHRACFAKNVPMDNVTLHPCALGEKEGGVKMALSPHSTGGTHIGGEGDIPLKTMDSFGFEKVDFIKLDCEGYEVFALKGGEQTLLRCKPVICVEQKPHKWFGTKQYAAAEYLMGLGARLLGNFHDDLCFGW